jgi:hypothetical protein
VALGKPIVKRWGKSSVWSTVSGMKFWPMAQKPAARAVAPSLIHARHTLDAPCQLSQAGFSAPCTQTLVACSPRTRSDRRKPGGSRRVLLIETKGFGEFLLRLAKTCEVRARFAKSGSLVLE